MLLANALPVLSARDLCRGSTCLQATFHRYSKSVCQMLEVFVNIWKDTGKQLKVFKIYLLPLHDNIYLGMLHTFGQIMIVTFHPYGNHGIHLGIQSHELEQATLTQSLLRQGGEGQKRRAARMKKNQPQNQSKRLRRNSRKIMRPSK